MSSVQRADKTFWGQAQQQLAATPLALTVEREAFYSPPEWDVYRLHYTGWGGYRLFAWLSVPRRPGPFPALLRMPDYGSVHDIIHTALRHDAVVMNPTYRGQRLSDTPFQAQYPGLLTAGLEHPDTYIMRQVFVDALRAVEALRQQTVAEVHTIALTGAGLGGALALATAAHCPGLSAVAADTPLALGHPATLTGDPTYPLAELHDYLRLYPERREQVLACTAPLNLLPLAAQMTVPVLLSLGRYDRGLCPLAIGEELAAHLPQGDIRIYDGASEGGGHPHSVLRGQWLRAQLSLGLP